MHGGFMKNTSRFLILLSASLILASCGGGKTTSGASSSSEPAATSSAPTSSAPTSSSPTLSSSSSVEEKLDAPVNLRFEKGVFKWGAVTGAEKYVATLLGVSHEVSENQFDVSSLFVAAGTSTASVHALKGNLVGPDASVSVTAKKLDTPTVSVVSPTDGGNPYFQWGAISGASSYAYQVDGTNDWVSVNEPKWIPSAYGIYKIKAKAVGDISGLSFYLDSDVSALSEEAVVAEKSVLTITSAGQLTFTSVSNATRYDLYIDGALAQSDVSQTAGLNLLDSLLTVTGQYSVSVKAYQNETLLSESQAVKYSTPFLNENEFYSFDNEPAVPLLSAGNVTASLSSTTIHGTKGFSYDVKVGTGDTTTDFANLDFDVSRTGLAADLKKAASISFWIYAVKPEGYTGDSTPSNKVIPYVEISSQTGDAGKGYGTTAAGTQSFAFGTWTQVTISLPSARDFLDKESPDFRMTMSLDNYWWGLVTDASAASAWTRVPYSYFEFYLDDITYTMPFDPSTQGFAYYHASVGGVESISVPVSGGTASTAYTATMAFRVMAADGSAISGVGGWGRRIAFDGNQGNLYWLISEAVGGNKSSYDPENFTMPSPTTVITYSFATTLNAAGEIPLNLDDFNAGEIFAVVSVSLA
jgi:hypothetical protein